MDAFDPFGSGEEVNTGPRAAASGEAEQGIQAWEGWICG